MVEALTFVKGPISHLYKAVVGGSLFIGTPNDVCVCETIKPSTCKNMIEKNKGIHTNNTLHNRLVCIYVYI